MVKSAGTGSERVNLCYLWPLRLTKTVKVTHLCQDFHKKCGHIISYFFRSFLELTPIRQGSE